MNLFSGDIYATKKWKSYYTIEPNEIKHKGATFGLFEEASIIGMLVDRDRGFINFFKDGNDMGQAYVDTRIKEMELHPFIQTGSRCTISIFHPSVYPLYGGIPEEPTPPPPVLQSNFLDTTVPEATLESIGPASPKKTANETPLERSGATPYLGLVRESLESAIDEGTLEETKIAMMEFSLEYMNERDIREMEKVLEEDHDAKPHDLRDSHRFSLEETLAGLAKNRDPEIQAKIRKSIKVRHHDVKLDAFVPHVKDVQANRTKYYRDGKAIFQRESETTILPNLSKCYDEDHDLTLQLSYDEFVRDMKPEDTIRPSEGSNQVQDKQIETLEKRAKDK